MNKERDDLFAYSPDFLQERTDYALKYAKRLGAAQAVIELSEGYGQHVSIRKAELETLEHTQDQSMSMTVFLSSPTQKGFTRGNVSTANFSDKALQQAVEAALAIARHTEIDDCAGLPDPDLLSQDNRADQLELMFPWHLSSQAAIDLAKQTEAAAFALDKRVQNSEGASVSSSHGRFWLANTHGFSKSYAFSRHSISMSPVVGEGDQLQTDYWYSSMRNPHKIWTPEQIGQRAAQRALAKLNPKKLSSRSCRVLFEAPLACGLLGGFVQAASGSALYRRSTFLLDRMGQSIMAPHLSIHEDPFVPEAFGSAPFDQEGVKVSARHLVDHGTLQGWFLSSYTARKLGLVSTGNAGGSHNLYFTSSNTQAHDDFAAMLKKLDTGFVVTDLMGDGVNYITGEYSRGASGFWVENGEIVHAVDEVTIAGNLQDMWKNIESIGSDVINRGTKYSGSVLISNMVVAGN